MVNCRIAMIYASSTTDCPTASSILKLARVCTNTKAKTTALPNWKITRWRWMERGKRRRKWRNKIYQMEQVFAIGYVRSAPVRTQMMIR